MAFTGLSVWQKKIGEAKAFCKNCLTGKRAKGSTLCPKCRKEDNNKRRAEKGKDTGIRAF